MNTQLTTQFQSPAKINLFLRILNRRADGYHELATLMQAIDLSDTLTITPSQQDSFTCSDPALPTDDSNLVVRSLALFRNKTGRMQPFSIHLEKRIPHQAGLGGGSSNAATTLWALDTLCETDVPTETLSTWGAELGSDISFFFSTGTALCCGRGEQVQNVPSLPLPPLTIYKPEIGLSTPAVFKALDLSMTDSRTPEALLDQFQRGDLPCCNDLQAPAFGLLPELQDIQESLIVAGHTHAHLSGSGTSLFAFGSLTRPADVAVQAYPCSPIQRAEREWYTPPNSIAAIL